jgi:hypothetical protein
MPGSANPDLEGGRVAQDNARLLLHRAAIPRRPQAQAVFQVIVELSDCNACH